MKQRGPKKQTGGEKPNNVEKHKTIEKHSNSNKHKATDKQKMANKTHLMKGQMLENQSSSRPLPGLLKFKCEARCSTLSEARLEWRETKEIKN